MAKPVHIQEEAHPGKPKFGPPRRQRENPAAASGADEPPNAADKRSAQDAGSAGDDAGSKASAKQIAPDAVKQWARQLNVPAPRLRQAIWRVGPLVDDVKRFLANSPH